MGDVYDEVQAERARQDARWGEQNHAPMTWLAVLVEEVGEVAERAIQAHVATMPWEEDEALRRYREELVQVAAVAVAAVESLDRGAWRG